MALGSAAFFCCTFRPETVGKFILLFLFPVALTAHSQDSTIAPQIRVSGFLDVFYAYDLNRPTGTTRQSFFYNHNRHNEFNLNLGFIKLGLEHTKYRANLALHAGTYVVDNYAQEPGMLKNLFEANVGLSLNKKNDLWLDAGIFASHIGFESAITSDNWTLTRSILAENSPYYFSGAKVSYTPNEKWLFSALVLNGWQRIQRLDGNSMLSFGSQITYTKKDKIQLNWSTFIGTDSPDTNRKMRYFSNVYGKFQLNKHLSAIAGFDYGIQQKSKDSTAYATWFSPVLIVRYAWKENWALALRGEYYEDRTGVIINTFVPGGFRSSSISLNLDYSPINNVLCRIEGRYLYSDEAILPTRDLPVKNDLFFTAAINVGFGAWIRK